VSLKTVAVEVWVVAAVEVESKLCPAVLEMETERWCPPVTATVKERRFPVVFVAATVMTVSEVEQTHFFHCQIPEVVALEKGYSLFHFLFSLQHYHHRW
jgi:hypothetical protein